MQSLADFETDHAGAEHRHRARQVIPAEHIVIDNQTVAGSAQGWRQVRRRTGGDHRAAELDAVRDCAIGTLHLERVWTGEVRVANELVAGGDLVDPLEHEADEAVTLAANPRHHSATVDSQRAIDPQAEGGPVLDPVGSLSSGDQQLAGHATDPRAGGTKRPALNDDGALPGRHRRAVGGQSGGTGTQHGDVDGVLHGGHLRRLCRCGQPTRRGLPSHRYARH